MDFFKEYSSNTYAGSGNQLYFNMDDGEIRTGRVFYKIAVGGEYDYSILFSNIIDSTYSEGLLSNGSLTHKNLICDSWEIHEARIGKCKEISDVKDMVTMASDYEDDAGIVVFDLRGITFGGQKTKKVMPGEFFSSDPIKVKFEEGEYLCLEVTFSGSMIPFHGESLLPVYIKGNEGWKYYKRMPFAGMVGCNRKVKGRIAYLGDSITQGIGAGTNSYLHWNALLSKKIGHEYAFWNLGIGYGRANDAASDGAWLYKAKQNDIIFVCYGVNDILRGMPEEQIKTDLMSIVSILKKCGKKVVLQTIPPYNYQGDDIGKWQRINLYIKNELKNEADMIFDNNEFLAKDKENLHMPKYGGHPNAEGCAIWAEALYAKVKPFLEETCI